MWDFGNILLGLGKYSSGGWENIVVGLGRYSSGVGKYIIRVGKIQ